MEIKKLRYIKHKLNNALFNFRYFINFTKSKMKVKEADSILHSFHQMPESSSLTENKIGELNYDLTVIVPVYNGEKWVEQCIDSVLDQKTEYTYSLRIINDGSTDHTEAVLRKYADNKKVEIIKQENKGYSGARNRGLKNICSQYIMFLDSDDRLLPDAITSLLNKAFETDADIVEGNGIRFNDSGVIGPIKEDSKSGPMGVPWMKVYRSTLFEKVQFPEQFLYEDKVIGSIVLQIAKSTVVIPESVYAYRIHSESITQKHDSNPKRLDSYWIMWLMQRDQEKFGIYPDYTNYVRSLRQVVMTYRRTVLLPENIKEAIFAGTRQFFSMYYSDYIKSDRKYKKLADAIIGGWYGRYRLFCETYMI